MIQELVNFGKRKTKGKSKALKEEYYSIILIIDEDGNYRNFNCVEKQLIEAETITAKKGKARFLLDKCEEVLGVHIDVSKLEAFKRNLEPFKEVPGFIPIIKFYDKQNVAGLKKAIEEYVRIDKDCKFGNMTFVVNNSVLLATEEVQNAIKKHIIEQKRANIKNSQGAFLKNATFSTAVVINNDGVFQGFTVGEDQIVLTESITAKNNESLLLCGEDAELLGITKDGVGKKHQLFLDKLYQYKEDITSFLEPVLKFYDKNNENGLRKAIADSVYRFDKDFIGENITFMVTDSLLLKQDEVKQAIIDLYCNNEKKLSNGKVCSICGKTESPVVDEPHGLVRMPKGQTAGCALVSYNEAVFESYGLKGNLNSSICRDCARNYIEGLKCLLSEGYEVPKNEKQKAHFEYNHRINISDSTVALFWTRQETEYENPFLISNPDESWVKRLFESVMNGKKNIGSTVETNMFYSCTLSSAAARIAVRDWTAISLDEYKKNLAEWFQDIEIRKGDLLIYSPLRMLVNATQRDKKPGEKQSADTNAKSRIGTLLWNSAINGRMHIIPLEVLQSVLNRIWKGEVISSERAAIIKLVINRNTNKNMKSTLDETNTSIAYLCGRLFAVIESMQWKAIGKVNSSVKDRYFTAVASQPAYIFGILLTKHVPVYQHKIGGYLAKELNEIAGTISEQGELPQRFSAIEQGEFALGYYFQKTHKPNSETKEIIN